MQRNESPNVVHVEMEMQQQNEQSERKGWEVSLEQCPKKFKDTFDKLRYKIQQAADGALEDVSVLESLVKSLVREAEACKPRITHPLDVTTVDENDHKMTLLAFSLCCKNKKITEMLIENGASIQSHSDGTGSPLFQAINHCYAMLADCKIHNETTKDQHTNTVVADSSGPSEMAYLSLERNIVIHSFDDYNISRKTDKELEECKCYDQLDYEQVKDMINSYCNQQLNQTRSQTRECHYSQCPQLNSLVQEGESLHHGVCYMAFLLRQQKIAKILIQIGADFLATECYNLPPYLLEYCKSGTTNYLSWLFSVLPEDKCNKLVDHIFDKFVNRQGIDESVRRFGRNHVHALLLTGNKPITRKVLERRWELLLDTDSKQRTALHIGAEMGVVDIVAALLEMNADLSKRDEDGRTPLMVAASKRNREVVKYIVGHRMNSRVIIEHLGQSPEDGIDGAGENMIVEELKACMQGAMSGHTDNAEGKCNEMVDDLLIAAVKTRNLKAVETILLQLGAHPSKELLSCTIKSGDIKILESIDSICAENGEYNRINGLLQACWLGVPVSRDFYYDKLSTQQRNEALYQASATGNNIALEFLLSKEINLKMFSRVRGSNFEGSPLLIAASRGYSKCVKLLVEAHADLQERDQRGYNCLMVAIERKHIGVVKVLLNLIASATIKREPLFQLCGDSNEGTTFNGHTITHTFTTPIRMLIEHMPDMAEQFLDFCVHEPFSKGNGFYIYDYEYIDDLEAQWMKDEHKRILDAKPHKRIHTMPDHVLSCMIKSKRFEMLSHKLITSWIKAKWRSRTTMAFYILILAMYCIYLALLTAFSLIVPRPADSIACVPLDMNGSNNTSGSINSSGNGSAYVAGSNVKLYGVGGILILLSLLHIVIEAQQLYVLRIGYIKNWENYLQLFVFIGAIVFIATLFGSNQWCASAGMWQFGAAVVSCAWFNSIVMLKEFPFGSIGAYTTLLLAVCGRYLKLVFLPILLTATFGFPFYMLLVQTATDRSTAFSDPVWSLLSTYFGTPGFDTTFVRGSVAYPAMGIILFTLFTVVVTVLFTNMLIGLSTGDALDALRNAHLINKANQVKFILFLDIVFPCFKQKLKKYGVDTKILDHMSFRRMESEYRKKYDEWFLYNEKDEGEDHSGMQLQKRIQTLAENIQDQQMKLQHLLDKLQHIRAT